MINLELLVQNELGIHARSASKLVRTCKKYQSEINAVKEGKIFDLKHVLGAMMLKAKLNEVVSVSIEGPDEEQAAAELKQLFDSKFGEQ